MRGPVSICYRLRSDVLLTRSMSSLYLLRLGKTNHYKIGISRSPCERLAQVCGGKYAVEIVGVWPDLSHMENNCTGGLLPRA